MVARKKTIKKTEAKKNISTKRAGLKVKGKQLKNVAGGGSGMEDLTPSKGGPVR